MKMTGFLSGPGAGSSSDWTMSAAARADSLASFFRARFPRRFSPGRLSLGFLAGLAERPIGAPQLGQRALATTLVRAKQATQIPTVAWNCSTATSTASSSMRPAATRASASRVSSPRFWAASVSTSLS